jgi:GMP synthase (glutamine-hydrolysing)
MVREIGIYCELLPYDVDDDFIKKFNPKGVILSGGPDTATLNDSARAPQIVFDLDVFSLLSVGNFWVEL